MQVPSISSTQNNHPHFNGIQKILTSGLYKKHPEMATELVEMFMQNPAAVRFSKQYDVDIYLHAAKGEVGIGSAESSIHIFYDNPAASKLKKFWNSINGNREKIELIAYGNRYNTEESLKESHSDLVTMILPEEANGNGLLSAHIKLALEEINKALSKKAEKQAIKNKAKDRFDKAKSELDNAIDKAISQTKEQ